MKQVTFILLMMCTTLLYAQESQSYSQTDELTFFGADFSMARVYGVAEEPFEYKMLFRDMNNLFKSEPDTYNLKKFFNKKEVIYKLEKTSELNSAINANDLKVLNKEYNVTEPEIKRYVQAFDTGDATGYGAILIGTFLDRSKGRTTYYLVIFETQTKEIERIKKIEAKAAGNNMKNYWAGSMLNALKAANK